MAGSWQKQTGTAPDPLAAYRGQPFISEGSSQASYVGRVIIELWEKPNKPDASGLAYQVDPVDGNVEMLLQRIATALPMRLAKKQTS